MAKPRVFISSTFYDLRHVREDLERFIKELGYDPIRHETGAIPYGKEQRPESYAYKEVELCDIIVTVIGGRYGTESQDEKGYSITQNELRRALEKGVQVFIFVEQNVLSEFSTWQLNREAGEVKWRFVDDSRVYEFIEKLQQLPKNNPIAPLLEEIKTVAGTLQQLVKFLTEERRNKDAAIQSILLAGHPVFRRFAQITGTTYRVFFTNLAELNEWLKARSWAPVESAIDDDSAYEWFYKDQYIKLTEDIFDESGQLKVYTTDTWKDEWLTRRKMPETEPEPPDDDIPF